MGNINDVKENKCSEWYYSCSTGDPNDLIAQFCPLLAIPLEIPQDQVYIPLYYKNGKIGLYQTLSALCILILVLGIVFCVHNSWKYGYK